MTFLVPLFNISLLIIATMIVIDKVYERLQIGNITTKIMILAILFIVTSW